MLLICILNKQNLFTNNSYVSKQWRIQDQGGMDPSGERGPPTLALFGENVCKNERIGSRGGACAGNFCMQIRHCQALL